MKRERANTCVVCSASFYSYRRRRHCSDACRKREARGEVCKCGHYESKHVGSEMRPCTARVGMGGRGTCYCGEFRPRAAASRVPVDRLERTQQARALKGALVGFCVALMVLCSGCSSSTPPIACAGPLPITCTCVTACDFSETWPVLETSAGLMARDACVPWCTRRDRP